MGEIVGAAIVSHHPGLFQTDEFRKEAGAGVGFRSHPRLSAGCGRASTRSSPTCW